MQKRCDAEGNSHELEAMYINELGAMRIHTTMCLSLQQGAGMELQQVSSKDKEKTMLDRQHEHLIRCLEKATVSRHKNNDLCRITFIICPQNLHNTKRKFTHVSMNL